MNDADAEAVKATVLRFLAGMNERPHLLADPEVARAVRLLHQTAERARPLPQTPPGRPGRAAGRGDGIMGERVESLFVPK